VTELLAVDAHGGNRPLRVDLLEATSSAPILDKLIKRDITKFQAAWAVAFPGRLMNDPGQIQPDEVTRGPWLVILTRMGATREETTDILERVGRRW